jgi:DNA-binding response OmpR family regulator
MIKTPSKRKKIVLIVEDEKSLREAIANILRLNDFAFFEAKNGKEGVALALSKHPDIILLDLVMPEMDGMTALRKIREDRWGAHAAVIILTNVTATNEHLIDDVITQKPMNYLIKSDWKLHDVVEKIESVLAE